MSNEETKTPEKAAAATEDGADVEKTPVKDGEMVVTVKTPKTKKNIIVDAKIDVKSFKEKISAEFQSPVAQLCLIFAGKILKDEDTLEGHNIKDGMTVHLVIKSGSQGNNQSSSSQNEEPNRPADTSQTPFGLGGIGGLPGMANLGMGSANFMEMQQRVQSEIMGNPDMMRQLMDSPLTQSLMSNPEILRSLISSNPQMQQLMERNPEINHMLNNPDILRQTMEIARNPAMLQELMRNQDRAMSNLESIPGGQSALQRMYRDIQEPMLNAAQEQFGSNPFQALSGDNSGSQGSGSTGESAAPMPNPWGGTSTQSGSATSTSNTARASGSDLAGGNLFHSPAIQSLMQQMRENPQLMQNMMNAPYTQSMFQTLSQNPDMATRIISSNPLFAGNPQMQEQMRNMMPTFLQQMQNPAVQGLMTNPEALGALQQIQQGMQRLQTAAPDVYSTMGMPTVGPGLLPGTASSSTTTTTTTSTTSSSTNTSSTTESNSRSTNSDSDANNSFANLMNQMVNSMSGQGLNNPPEERFRSQLEQLAAMGFVDQQANIQALIATYGDVNAAIDRLLNSRPPGQQS